MFGMSTRASYYNGYLFVNVNQFVFTSWCISMRFNAFSACVLYGFCLNLNIGQ